MSSVKERAKMFSTNNNYNSYKDVERELIQKNKVPMAKKKLYIIIGASTAVVLFAVIVIIIVATSKGNSSNSKSDSSPNSTEKKTKESDSTKSDSTKSDSIESDSTKSDSINSDSTDETEPDFVQPDCTGICDKPYNILVYSDSKLKSKLLECGYLEGSAYFTFSMENIKRHNLYRACHNAPPLIFNCELMKKSQNYTEYSVAIGKFEHSWDTFHGEWMGENLAGVGGWLVYSVTGATPVDMWYKEINSYDFDNPRYIPGTGHFTQVVWKASLELGVGFVRKDDKCYFTNNYFPGGNYNNMYDTQVQGLQK